MSYMPMRYGEKWPLIAKGWDTMKINKSRMAEVERTARRMIANKERYVKVEQKTGVPWYMIAALHQREASGNFNTYLGNGEPLNRVTRLVPKGRGPFSSWEAGAIDALRLQKFHTISDWRIEKILFQSVLYNGLGYEMRKLHSPYVWGASSHQQPGKFTSDGKFSRTAIDQQLGVAALIKKVAELDPSVEITRET